MRKKVQHEEICGNHSLSALMQIIVFKIKTSSKIFTNDTFPFADPKCIHNALQTNMNLTKITLSSN